MNKDKIKEIEETLDKLDLLIQKGELLSKSELDFIWTSKTNGEY